MVRRRKSEMHRRPELEEPRVLGGSYRWRMLQSSGALQVHVQFDYQVAFDNHLVDNLCLDRPLGALLKMVNVLKGVLIECDPAMKQFLLYLDDTNALGKKFIIQDLDETHLFVLAEVVHILQEKVGDLMDQNSFPITQK
ncbi:general transcription factor IIH subunit 5 isoform X1 [Heptranchias perlo]|uniref:general transcription factor IIH subunit 5 isoform X1 n=2 Tax=Heptranchias perlo TaxID=212740 RepID=UPI00355A9437